MASGLIRRPGMAIKINRRWDTNSNWVYRMYFTIYNDYILYDLAICYSLFISHIMYNVYHK